MPGYVTIVGPCYACKRVFSFNPTHVPSIHIDPQTGLPPDVEPQAPGGYERARREPLCRDCVERMNVEREARGDEAWPIHPDAYDAEPEEQVLWDD